MSTNKSALANVFEPANMIVALANVLFFMLVQTLFFRYIASKQFDAVIKHKAKIAEEYIKYDKDAALKYQTFKLSKDADEVKAMARKQEQDRDKINIDATIRWIGIPFFIVTCIFIFFLWNLKGKWDGVDSILLGFVAFAYITEVIFYFGLVRQYQYYGDQSIYSNLYNGIDSNVNKEPVTKEGVALKKSIDALINQLSTMSKGPINTEDIKNLFKQHQKNFPGISEEFFITYAEAKMKKFTDFVDMSLFDEMSGVNIINGVDKMSAVNRKKV